MNRITYSTLCALTLAMTACGGDNTPDNAAQSTALNIAGANTAPMTGTTLVGAKVPAANPALPTQLAADVTVVQGPAGQNGADYVPKLTETFDSVTLNTALWNNHIWYETSNPTKNYTVENSALKIWPQRDATGKFFNRTIDTDGRFSQLYGYFEIEAKLPKGKGTWPAFWLLNHSTAKRPEIDIMKAMPGAPDWGTPSSDTVLAPTAYGPTSWFDAGQQAGFKLVKTTDLSAGFHKYGMKWEPNKQTFYLDGVVVHTINASISTPMYILLDLWFGGASGTPDHTTPTGPGNAFQVNYVRTWQFKNGVSAPLSDAAASTTPTTTAPTTTAPTTTTKTTPTTTTPTTTTPTTTAPSTSTMTPFGQDAAAFTLSYTEEFTGTALNTARWNDKIWYEAAPGTKNYTVENGALKIWPARDASGKFFNRTIDTDGKYYQTYGYFEIEAKLPVGKGTWPAFWLFNHIGARRPEIDIMEAYAGGVAPWGKIIDGAAHPTMYAATVWKDATVQAGMIKVPTVDLSAGFHKYALKWEANKQSFYFDGKLVGTINVTMADPMYLMLDLWYGSASGTPDNSTPTGKSNSYEINYVRAWKMK